MSSKHCNPDQSFDDISIIPFTTLLSDDINIMHFTTLLFVQIAEWHVHKDLCNKTEGPWFDSHLMPSAVTSLCSPRSFS